MKHELGPLFPPWPPQKVYDQIEKVVCKSEPPWIEKAAKIASDCYFGFGPSGKCEGWEEIVRTVLAFASRAPRTITDTMVEAAKQTLYGNDDSLSETAIAQLRAALEAAEKARLWLGRWW